MEILGYKDGSKLVFVKNEGTVHYDFKDKSFYKTNPKSGTYRKLKNGAQAFFRGISVEDILNGLEDKAYATFLMNVNKGEKRCRNVATLLERMEQYSILEHYAQAGIKFTNPETFSIPVQKFAKPVREFMTTSRYNFSIEHKSTEWEWQGYNRRRVEVKTYNSWEKVYMANEELFINLCTYVNTNYNRDLEVYRLWIAMTDSYNGKLDVFKQLVTTYKLEYKSLFDYLIKVHRYEALNFNEACLLLRDYLKMCRDLNRRSYDKYPKYLRIAHDLINRNYKNFNKSYDETVFAQKVNRELAWSKGDYQIMIPQTTKDIKTEATELDHCVASYIDRVMDGTTQIVFLRVSEKRAKEDRELNKQLVAVNNELSKELGTKVLDATEVEEAEKQEAESPLEFPSLVTVEVRDGAIVQARGLKNRPVSDEESEWLKLYAKEKNLTY